MRNKQEGKITERQVDEVLERATRSLPRQKVTETEKIKNGEW